MKNQNKKRKHPVAFSKILIYILFLIPFIGIGQQVAKVSDQGIGYLEYLPADYSSSTKLYPAIIFLHGSGERGDGSPAELEKVQRHGPPKHVKNGSTMCFEVNGVEECFIVLSPQTNRWTWVGYEIIPLVQYALEEYRIDPDRVFLTGFSMGGEGSWKVAYSAENEPNVFAGIAPVAGRGDFQQACIVAQRQIPVWAFHGSSDTAMPIASGQRPINGMNACNPNPAPIFTVYQNLGHTATLEPAYRMDNSLHSPNLYEWFLQQRRGEQTELPPQAPTNLTATITSASEAVASWTDNSNNEQGFVVELANGNNPYLLVDTLQTDEVSANLTGLMENIEYSLRVQAFNESGVSAYANYSFSITNDTSNAPVDTVLIIDNDFQGLTLNGSWSTSTMGGPNKYGIDYFHDNNEDKGNKSANLTIPVSSGSYEIFARWYAFENRATNVPYEIIHEGGLSSVLKNQRENNAEWVSLGEYDFDSTVVININNTATDGYVIIDAFKLEGKGIVASPEQGLDTVIIDNDDARVTTTGSWTLSTAGGSNKYGINYLHDNNDQKGEKQISYDLQGFSGNYEIFARWYAFENRATNVTYKITGFNGVDSVVKDQTLNNGEWTSLGSYSFDGTGEVFIDNAGTNGYVVADAMKLEPILQAATMNSNSNSLSLATSDSIVVYPNPISGDFSVNTFSEVESYYHITLLNEVGEKIYNHSVRGKGVINIPLDINNVPTGVAYLMLYKNSKFVEQIRVLIRE